jgi:hypothetical protein
VPSRRKYRRSRLPLARQVLGRTAVKVMVVLICQICRERVALNRIGGNPG